MKPEHAILITGLLLVLMIALAPVMRCEPTTARDMVINGETGRAEIREVEICK